MMQFHITARRGGKTSRAMAWLVLDPANRVIVCHSAERAADLLRTVKREHPWAGVTAANFVSARGEQLRGRRAEIYVEDLDALIANMFAGNIVAGVSATGEVVDTVAPTAPSPYPLSA